MKTPKAVPTATNAASAKPARITELKGIYKKFELEILDINVSNMILVDALAWMDRKMREYAVARKLTQKHAESYKKVEKIRARAADPGVPEPERETSLCMALRQMEKFFDPKDVAKFDEYFQRREKIIAKNKAKAAKVAAKVAKHRPSTVGAPTPANAKTPRAPRTISTNRATRMASLIVVKTEPAAKAGSDKAKCFDAIKTGAANGGITVEQFLAAASPLCRKPTNAAWYLSAFISDGNVELEAPVPAAQPVS